jgi:hypothetical protein
MLGQEQIVWKRRSSRRNRSPGHNFDQRRELLSKTGCAFHQPHSPAAWRPRVHPVVRQLYTRKLVARTCLGAAKPNSTESERAHASDTFTSFRLFDRKLSISSRCVSS